ncbi:hypothetical protein [Nostoc sp.]
MTNDDPHLLKSAGVNKSDSLMTIIPKVCNCDRLAPSSLLVMPLGCLL